nr:unnamed protein product [Callosobruchus chinensis]
MQHPYQHLKKLSLPARDGDISFSPILGILIGATLTIIIVIFLIIVRIRRAQNQSGAASLEQKVSADSQQHQNTVSSTKPLLRSASPREIDNERDPDVIPAKYGSPSGDPITERPSLSLNGPQVPPSMSLPQYPQISGVPPAQWVSPVSSAAQTLPHPAVDQYHQYNNPVAMAVGGTFPRESRPKDLRLGNGSSTLQRVTDVELNGLAIKERLMASRLPESCV